MKNRSVNITITSFLAIGSAILSSVSISASAQEQLETLGTLVEKFLHDTAPAERESAEIIETDESGAILPPSLKQPKSNTQNEPVSLIYQTLPRYRECLQALRQDLVSGHHAARQWVSDGGGPPARHCLAIADLASGTPKVSAVRLRQLGEDENAGDIVTRTNVLAQSAEIWLGLNEPLEAMSTLTPAFILSPENGTLHLLAGRIHARAKRWEATVQAVKKAREFGVTSAEGFVASGRALKELTRFDDAAKDVARALQIDPFNLDALVLRGELAQMGVIINTRFRRIDEPADELPVIRAKPLPEEPIE